jgi:hypothetical protein
MHRHGGATLNAGVPHLAAAARARRAGARHDLCRVHEQQV